MFIDIDFWRLGACVTGLVCSHWRKVSISCSIRCEWENGTCNSRIVRIKPVNKNYITKFTLRGNHFSSGFDTRARTHVYEHACVRVCVFVWLKCSIEHTKKFPLSDLHRLHSPLTTNVSPINFRWNPCFNCIAILTFVLEFFYFLLNQSCITS